jgi:membrane protein DedA with SNARE-associated domain
VESIYYLVIHYGYAGLFVMLMFGIFLGLPIPDEILMIFVGYLASTGKLVLVPAILVAFAGSSSGITVSYTIGRTVGPRVAVRWGRFVRITPERLDQARQWFERFGKWSLTLGYFVPGFRHVMAIVAGASGLPWRTFALFAYGGALLWAATFILLGYFLAEKWQSASGPVQTILLIIAGLTGLTLLVILLVHWLRSRRK